MIKYFIGIHLPLVYAFLTHKEEASYRILYIEFSKIQPGYDNKLEAPKESMTDFEKAILNAISKTYGGDQAIIYG